MTEDKKNTATVNDESPNVASVEGPARLKSITQKVPTQFANFYAAVSFDRSGAACEVAFSTPGKHLDTAVGDAVEALGRAVTQIIQSGRGVA